MTTETMTIHQALCELKTLDARIEKLIDERDFVVTRKASVDTVGRETVKSFEENVKSHYQRIIDLIKRRSSIKKAVVLSNASTKVVVGTTEYTIAEAIEMKNHGIYLSQLLCKRIINDLKSASQFIDSRNGDALEERADKHIANIFGSAPEGKNLSEQMAKMRQDFIDAQRYIIVDPIKAEEKIKAFQKAFDEFTVNIDSALSVSNATTKITITY